MDKKQLLIAFAILGGTFVLILGSVAVIYYFYPASIGLAPSNSNFENTADNKILSKSDSLKARRMRDSAELELPYDSLKNITFTLKDSLSLTQQRINNYNDSITGLAKRINELNKNESGYADSIQKAKDKMLKALSDLKKVETDLKNKDTLFAVKKDSLKEQNFIQYAKIYNNAGAVEVAKILEKLDGKDASKILKLMQPKKAGKVIEAMKPDIAAKILLN